VHPENPAKQTRTAAGETRLRVSGLGPAGNIRGWVPAIRGGADVFPGGRREAGDSRKLSADAPEQFPDGRGAGAAMVAKCLDRRRVSGAEGRAASGGRVAPAAAPRAGRVPFA
jgi:hypothetical protein